MGDMADYTLNHIIDTMDIRHDPEDDYGPRRGCKYCGEQRIYWKEIKTGWRLHNLGTPDPHVCAQYIFKGEDK